MCVHCESTSFSDRRQEYNVNRERTATTTMKGARRHSGQHLRNCQWQMQRLGLLAFQASGKCPGRKSITMKYPCADDEFLSELVDKCRELDSADFESCVTCQMYKIQPPCSSPPSAADCLTNSNLKNKFWIDTTDVSEKCR